MKPLRDRVAASVQQLLAEQGCVLTSAAIPTPAVGVRTPVRWAAASPATPVPP